MRVFCQTLHQEEGVGHGLHTLILQGAALRHQHHVKVVAATTGNPAGRRAVFGDFVHLECRRHYTSDGITQHKADIASDCAHSSAVGTSHRFNGGGGVLGIDRSVGDRMHVEGIGRTGRVMSCVVQKCHHDVVAAVPLKRLVQGNVDPVVGAAVVEIECAIIHKSHIAHRHPVGTVGERVLGRIGKVDFNLAELRRGVDILERDTVDFTIDAAYFGSVVNLLAVGIGVIGAGRQTVGVRVAVAHKDTVHTVEAGVVAHCHRCGDGIRLASRAVHGCHRIMVRAVGDGFGIAESRKWGGGEEDIVTIYVVSVHDMVVVGHRADDNPVVVA